MIAPSVVARAHRLGLNVVGKHLLITRMAGRRTVAGRLAAETPKHEPENREAALTFLVEQGMVVVADDEITVPAHFWSGGPSTSSPDEAPTPGLTSEPGILFDSHSAHEVRRVVPEDRDAVVRTLAAIRARRMRGSEQCRGRPAPIVYCEGNDLR
jgi:hypothetical protein